MVYMCTDLVKRSRTFLRIGHFDGLFLFNFFENHRLCYGSRIFKNSSIDWAYFCLCGQFCCCQSKLENSDSSQGYPRSVNDKFSYLFSKSNQLWRWSPFTSMANFRPSKIKAINLGWESTLSLMLAPSCYWQLHWYQFRDCDMVTVMQGSANESRACIITPSLIGWTQNPEWSLQHSTHPWASCQMRKIAGCACAVNAGNVFPTTVSESLTGGFLWSRWRKNVPGIPGACATGNFTYLVRGPWGNRTT